jgi:hypothetical protein
MTYIEYLIVNYKSKGVIVDTNLFLLLIVGSINPSKISEFKRTDNYSAVDFEFLMKFLSHFKIFTTPNIWTEVNNLTEGFGKIQPIEYQALFKILTTETYESYVHSRKIIELDSFKFGLSDSSIYQLAEMGFIILTDDMDFYQYAINNDRIAINFSHLRTEYLQL